MSSFAVFIVSASGILVADNEIGNRECNPVATIIESIPQQLANGRSWEWIRWRCAADLASLLGAQDKKVREIHRDVLQMARKSESEVESMRKLFRGTVHEAKFLNNANELKQLVKQMESQARESDVFHKHIDETLEILRSQVDSSKSNK
jgi:hypothetical protein